MSMSQKKEIKIAARQLADSILEEILPKQEQYDLKFVFNNASIKLRKLNGFYSPERTEVTYWNTEGMNFMEGFLLGNPVPYKASFPHVQWSEVYYHLMKEKGWKFRFAATLAGTIGYGTGASDYKDIDYFNYYVALTTGKYIREEITGLPFRLSHRKAVDKSPYQLGKIKRATGFTYQMDGYSRNTIKKAFKAAGVRINSIESNNGRYLIAYTCDTYTDMHREYNMPASHVWPSIMRELEKCSTT